MYGLIIGPSGVGKGYGVSGVLKEHAPVETFVTGDFCRDQAVKQASSGILVNDDVIQKAAIAAYAEHLRSAKHNAGFCFLIDAPRTIEQAQFFYEWFIESGAKPDSIITLHIDAQPDVCRQRIIDRATRQGRADDKNPSVIRRRLGVYFGQETPDSTDESYNYVGSGGVRHTIAPWLEANTRYHKIDGNLPLEDIRDSVRLCVLPSIFSA